MIYFKIMRLPHQLFCLVPLLLGILDSSNKLTSPTLLFFFAGFLLASTAGFVINEYIDSFDTDKFSADTRSSKDGKLNRNIVLTLLIGLTLLSFFFFWLSGLTGFLIGLAIYALMQIYSLPKIRLKNSKYFDVLDQIVAWGILPYLAPFFITGSPIAWLPLVFMLLFLTGASAIAPIIDISGDKQGGLVNTTVFWGYKKSLTLCFFSLYSSFIICLFFIYTHQYPWYWLMLPPGMLALGAVGYARGNVNRPEKTEKVLLIAKKYAKYCGWTLFAFLFILAL